MPLHIIHKGERLRSNWCTGGPDDASWDISPSGWMESQQFLKWFKNCFVPFVNNLAGTKLLFLDGHASRVSLELIKEAMSNNIVLMKLMPHTSSVSQPLDVGVFKTMKVKWKQILNEAVKKGNFTITKEKFGQLLRPLVEKGFLSENARSGFSESGLWPLNRDKITATFLAVLTLLC